MNRSGTTTSAYTYGGFENRGPDASLSGACRRYGALAPPLDAHRLLINPRDQ